LAFEGIKYKTIRTKDPAIREYDRLISDERIFKLVWNVIRKNKRWLIHKEMNDEWWKSCH